MPAFTSWLRSLVGRKPRPRPARRDAARPRAFALRLEALEDRLAPAVVVTFTGGALTLTYDGTAGDSMQITSQNTGASDFIVRGTGGTLVAGSPTSLNPTGVVSITATDASGQATTGEALSFDTNGQNSLISGAVSVSGLESLTLTDSTGTGLFTAASLSESPGTTATTVGLNRPFTATGAAGVSLSADKITVGPAGSITSNAGPVALTATTATTLSLAGTDVATTNQNITFTGPVVLGADVTLSSGTALTSFGGTVDATAAGGQALTVSGNASFGGAVGTTALKSLSVSGTTALNGGPVTTSGAQTYTGAATLGANTTLTSTAFALVSFGGTVNGAFSLTVPTFVTFSGAVGGSTALASVSTGPTGVTSINGGSVTTTGAQTYNGQVQLGANTTLTSTGSGNVSVAGALNGAFSLTVNTAGTTSFGSGVGGVTALTSLTTDAPGSTALNGVTVTTTGAQSYNDAVTLGANDTLTSTGSGNVTFGSTVNGGFGLTVNTAGVTTFGGAVGGSTALASVATDAAGSTALNGGSVTTSGAQAYADPVTLGANTTLTSTGSGTVGFGSTVNGAFSLTVNTAGTTTFSGAVGGTTELTSVTTDAPGTTQINGGSVTTTGAQTYNDAVTLGINATLTSTGSGNVTLGSTVNGASALTVNTAGTTTFGGAVGGTTALVSVTTDAAGSTALNGGSVTTSGAQSYNDAVTLGANDTLTSTGTGNVTFGGTVNGGFGLTVNTAGVTTFGGAVGGSTALSSLTTDAPGSTALNGGSVTTAGAQTYNDPVTLGAAATLTAGGASSSAAINEGSFLLTIATTGTWNAAGAITGFGGLTKNAAGTLTLAATDLYSGSTTVNAGTLLVDGVVTDSNVTVNSGGTLGGIGSVSGDATVHAGGAVAPGDSPGVLGILFPIFSSGSNFNAEIGGPTPGNGAGHHDQLDDSVVNLGGATLNLSSFGGYVPKAGDHYDVITSTTDLIGTFAGLPEGATVSTNFLGSGLAATITYQGGGGHDVVINVSSTPPPPPTTVYVDDSFAGTPPGTGPADDPIGGLVFGTNAFADIQSGINAVASGGTVVVYGGTYATPAALNVNKALAAIDISVNPKVPAETTVNVNETVTLTNSATFQAVGVGAGATPANLTFGSTVDAAAPGGAGLTINGSGANTADTFGGATGGAVPLSFVTITSGGAVALNAGNVVGALGVTADSVTLAGGSLNAGSVSLSAQNAVTLSAALNAGAGTVAIAAGQSGGSAGFTENSAGAVTTTNNTAAAIGITVGGTGNATLQANSTGTAGGHLTVHAGGSILNAAGNTLRLTTDVLTLTAGGEIGQPTGFVQTAANSLSASAGDVSTGLVKGIWVSNAGALTVTSATTTSGVILIDAAVTTSGDLTATSVTAGGSKFVRLRTLVGGNIVVGSVSAVGTVAFLTAAGAITDGNGPGVTNVTAALANLTGPAGIDTDLAVGAVKATSTNSAISLRASGTAVVNGISAGTGTITLGAGTFQTAASEVISDPSPLVLGATATLDLSASNNTETIGSLAGPAGAAVNLHGGTLITGGNNASVTFGGTITGTGGTLTKAGTGTFTLSGANTYTGPTNVNGGMLNLTGSLYPAATPGFVRLNTAGVALTGAGVVNGQVAVMASGTTVQSVTVQNVPGTGAGVFVQPNLTGVLVGGAGKGVTVLDSAMSTGILVQAGDVVTLNGNTVTGTGSASDVSLGVLVSGLSGGSATVNQTRATVLNNTINHVHVGLDVRDATALVQGNNLDNDTAGAGGSAAGLVVESGAVVDAGQLPSAAAYYGNFTGLGVSTGGNTWAGYTPAAPGVAGLPDPTTVPQAIRDLDTNPPNNLPGPQLHGNDGTATAFSDLTAQNNTFGTATSLADVEKVIYHDLDNSALGFVTYGSPAAGGVPHVVTDTSGKLAILYYASAPADGGHFDDSGIQRSVIRFVQVTFDSFVFLDPNHNRGLDLVKVNGPYGAPAGTLVGANVVRATFDQATGRYTVVYAFSGPGTEFGSLEDGNYDLQFFNNFVQGGGPGGPALATAVNDTFFRLFGDSNGDRQVDNTDLAAFQAAYRSRQGDFGGYKAYFDFNGDGAVDMTDYYQFLRRYKQRLNGDGSLSPIP